MRGCLVALGLALASLGSAHAADDRVVNYAAADARMNAAIAEARSTLDLFRAAFERASSDDREAFSLKVGLEAEGGGVEHIWINALELTNGAWSGALANEPAYLGPSMKLGSRVPIETARISDWMIIAPGGMYGSYTTRVILADLPEAEAKEIRAMLAPEPLPRSWRK